MRLDEFCSRNLSRLSTQETPSLQRNLNGQCWIQSYTSSNKDSQRGGWKGDRKGNGKGTQKGGQFKGGKNGGNHGTSKGKGKKGQRLNEITEPPEEQWAVDLGEQ